MLNILKMLAYSLSALKSNSDNEEDSGESSEILASLLLLSAHFANIGLLLMVGFPTAMDALAKNRNVSVLLACLLSVPYYYLIRRLIGAARAEFAKDEVAAFQAQRRWRLPALLYLAASWISFVFEIALLASRKGHL